MLILTAKGGGCFIYLTYDAACAQILHALAIRSAIRKAAGIYADCPDGPSRRHVKAIVVN